MPTDILTLPPSSLNTKWKEPYASASLNQRFVGITAPGIYRGLRIQPDPSLGDRTIQVAADPDKLDHVAVYENASGFSVTYRDGTSGDIVVSLAAYASVTVVVCIFVNYQTGVVTTGAFRVFTEAEFNALDSSVRDALVVLGTVIVPASGAIPGANISLLRRTLASTNVSRGTILNAPIIRNSGFEIGETNATHARSSYFWNKEVFTGTGSWKTSTAVVDSGMKSIELTITAGPLFARLTQMIGVPAVEGQLFLVSVRVKQLKTVISGGFRFDLVWADANDAVLTNTFINLDGGVVDSAFRTVETIIEAPAGAASLQEAHIQIGTLSPSSTGVFCYLDSIDIFVEPEDPQHPYPFDQTFRRDVVGTSLRLSDVFAGTNFSNLTGAVTFDRLNPSSEGSFRVEPANSASLPPALALLGRIYKLGSDLLSSEANALKPRIDADVSVVGGVDYTLMWQSVPAGQPGYRKYVSNTGQLIETVNATWSGVAWSKDVGGTDAVLWALSPGRVEKYVRIADAAWTTWTQINLTAGSQQVVQATPGTYLPMEEWFDSAGNRRVARDHYGWPRTQNIAHIHQPWFGSTGTPPLFNNHGFSGSIVGTGVVTSPLNETGRPGHWLRLQVVANTDQARMTASTLMSGNPPFPADIAYVVEFDVDGTALVGTPSLVFSAGFKHDAVAALTSEDSICLHKQAASANWKLVNDQSNAPNAQIITDTGIAVSGIQRFRLEAFGSNWPGGQRSLLYINGACVAQNTTGWPNGQAMNFGAWLTSTGAVNQSVYVSTMDIRMIRRLSDDRL